MPNTNYVPDPVMVTRLAYETPYRHVWWEEQLHLVLATEVIPEDDLEEFARACVIGPMPMAPAWVAELMRQWKNYHTFG